ncbi:MAG: RIP metalloprotease RseP, partial [Planctomycetes bacterium]|nr:RIP metalloprotease RseP [Planctomycetota bacterium]
MLDMLSDTFPSILAIGSILALWGKTWPYLLMFAGFSGIIFIHELGHFMVAKWAGVKVHQFAIGFGREIVGFTRGETRYSFNILPLGGYVRMLGQEDFDDKSEELRYKDDPRSFVNKPVSHRMAIVSAGVVMNVLLACVLFMIVFSVGKDSMSPRIAYIEHDSPAERAGLRPGDLIREINGEKILAFDEVRMAIVLAPMHVPVNFVVEREGELKSIPVTPEFLIPESTREAKRLVVGILPGVTRKISWLGPEVDQTRDDHPQLGDMIVEIDGTEVTDDNISAMINALAYADGDVYVERSDPDNPNTEPRRVRVDVSPILAIHPSGDGTGSLSVLGFAPLARFSSVHPRGRAHLAGLETGDTVLAWDDVPYPTRNSIQGSNIQSAERDIYFKVRKSDGRVTQGFVRPKRHKRGAATIHAICRPIDGAGSTLDAPRARFTDILPGGVADRAGIESGDVVLSCAEADNPTYAEVNLTIRSSTNKYVELRVQKSDGRIESAIVVPEAPGTIDAGLNLVPDDILRVAKIVETIDGRPSPAARAGLTAGILITAVNGEPVGKWRELVDAFRDHAGTSVELSYRDARNVPGTVDFSVPHSLRTLLGVGPEARILSIDGKRKVEIAMSRGPEQVAAGYRRGTRELLAQNVGRENVPVEFRRNPLAPIETTTVTVTDDMLYPWLAHVSYNPSINVAPEIVPLKGENLLESVEIGMRKTYYFIHQVYVTLERMIFTRSVGMDSLSGPLGIIDIGGRAARAGMIDFLFFMGIISANLAVLNFLPLPIVDGGLMVFLIIEKIKGTPVSLRVQVATQVIGLFLLVGA